MSGRAIYRTVYKHTGWRQTSSGWMYLHAGGAITAHGLATDVSVDLDEPLNRFTLPPPPVGADLHRAVRASLRLLTLSLRLMAPILGCVYRSVLAPVDCSLHLVGHTGQGKSELTALGQQHFGAGMSRLHLPANWLSTGNALERLAFLAKDAVLAVDDFKPGGPKADIDRMHQMADRVLRAQGNRSGRARCRADGTPLAQRPPRGMILSSGEDVPRGESLQARLFILYLAKGEIVLRALTPYQQDAAQGLYAVAMSAYLRWLASSYDTVRSALDGERASLRDKAAGDGHARTAGIIADLAIGWQYFLDFAVQAGAITAAERNATATEVWGALLRGAVEHGVEVAEQDPARQFLKLLTAAITSGRVHLTDREGRTPASPQAWGWQPAAHGGAQAAGGWEPQGRQAGWVEGDDLFLDPETAYAEVQRLGEDQGERLAQSKRLAYRHMKELGWLITYEKDKTTTRLTLQGRERAVLHLAADILTPPERGA